MSLHDRQSLLAQLAKLRVSDRQAVLAHLDDDERQLVHQSLTAIDLRKVHNPSLTPQFVRELQRVIARNALASSTRTYVHEYLTTGQAPKASS